MITIYVKVSFVQYLNLICLSRGKHLLHQTYQHLAVMQLPSLLKDQVDFSKTMDLLHCLTPRSDLEGGYDDSLCSLHRLMLVMTVTCHYSKTDVVMLLLCSVAQSFGWAATPNILLLFYPVPRNSFLHWLFGTDFPGLIKYHR